MTDTEKQAREWFLNHCSLPFLLSGIYRLLAAYGSSEYDRGLRDMKEKAAKKVENNPGLSPDTKRPLAAAIRQISEGGLHGR